MSLDEVLAKEKVIAMKTKATAEINLRGPFKFPSTDRVLGSLEANQTGQTVLPSRGVAHESTGWSLLL